MRRLAPLLFLCFAPFLHAQSGPISGFCTQGAVSAQTQNIPSTNKLQGIIPSCTVTVYLAGTQTLATLTSDGTTPLTNPFTANPAGRWLFYSSLLNQYDVVGSGGIKPNAYPTPVVLDTGSTPGGIYCPIAGCAFTGAVTGPLATWTALNATTANILNMNSVINAALDPTTGDIGQKATHALTACSNQCTVYIPAGNYTYTNTITLPLTTFAAYHLLLDDGAVLRYNGTGDAIQAVNIASPNVSNLRISGGNLIGSASATSAVHVQATNAVSISGMLIVGFSASPGILLDGVNGAFVYNNTIQSNQTGVWLRTVACNGATCGPTVTGSAFTPNNINVLSNRIDNNSHWGVLSDDAGTVTGSTGALNDIIWGNDLELNGSAGPTFGALSFGRSHGLVVDANYFEGSPRQVVLGVPGGSDGNQFRFYAAQGPQVTNNFFTDNIATPFDIELLDTATAQIGGNTTNDVTRSAANCFVNTLANNGTNIGETGTYFGSNHVENYSSTGNTLCIAGSGVNFFAGAGSYSITNPNYNVIMVNANYQIIGTGTSESVTVGSQVTAASSCFVGPFNAAAGPVALQSYFVPTGANTGTLYHPAASNGTRITIACASGVYN